MSIKIRFREEEGPDFVFSRGLSYDVEISTDDKLYEISFISKQRLLREIDLSLDLGYPYPLDDCVVIPEVNETHILNAVEYLKKYGMLIEFERNRKS
jgi:molybdenum cofactor biosynthesis enzyme MoaA